MSDTSSNTPAGVTRVDDHNLVATYETAEEARAALAMLERKGIEGGDIELFGPGVSQAREPVTNVEQRKTDLDATGAVGRRVGVLVVILVVVGFVAGGIIGQLSFDEGRGWLMCAAGGAIVGAIFGLLYGGYSKLPVNEQWGETFQDGEGETSVAVHAGDESKIDTAVQALKGSNAKRLAVFGRDGQLSDVA